MKNILKCLAFFLGVAVLVPLPVWAQRDDTQPVRVVTGKYEPTWTSLKQYRTPDWYKNAKFGIFIHWGVYSVPAFANEWYPCRMYNKHKGTIYEHHLKTYGPPAKFGYKDFIPRFKAEKWDPRQWVELFKKAGARYVVPVGEHHDGFPMYDCSYTKWDAVEMGPRRDIVGELAKEVRRAGLKLGVSSHRGKNWSYYTHSDEFDTNDPANAGLYGPPHPPKAPASEAFLKDWYARTVEIVDKYQPDLMWFDFGFNQPEFEPYRQRFGAYYYNKAIDWGRQVVINYKHDAFPEGTAVLDVERGRLDHLRELFWQTDTSVCWKSWGYIKDHQYKPVDVIVDELVDVVSKNGSLLLNIGPRPDGTIPEPQQQMLLRIGKWLDVNGEAIYGTRPFKVFGEGPTGIVAGHMKEKENKAYTAQDIRFTTKPGVLYVIALAWPEKQLSVQSLRQGSDMLNDDIADIKMLGSDEPVTWSRDSESLKIQMPTAKPCDYAYVFKITLRPN